jgi:hypothetical protein
MIEMKTAIVNEIKEKEKVAQIHSSGKKMAIKQDLNLYRQIHHSLNF